MVTAWLYQHLQPKGAFGMGASAMAIEVREVTPAEFTKAGEVTMAAYLEYVPSSANEPPGFSHHEWTEYLSWLSDVGGRAAHTLVLVALENGAIIGTATLELSGRVNPDADPLAADEAHVRMVAVDPHARNRGAGRALMEKCITAAREAGKTVITLNTAEEMKAAHHIYESMGFTQGPSRTMDNGVCLRSYSLPL
jgi:ribosomal protein S18 acetylase RimI-like enzyme